ncbi:CsbD family protein [Streptococcus ictaluri]|uniref:CsbD-like protein n=1 Tax=Streptococcus ictaluri 707-05 TaxID=764299 RepID=G5K304_9STRE|nr:CsbD family protein [Streptococcus ictaluri]EHI69483.1 CsbD-like protein [Streptococcus ictaluri 707-05]
MSEEKMDAKLDQFSGKVKETVGRLTDDKELETEGKTEHAKGKISEVLEDAKDGIKGFISGLKNDKEHKGE